MIDVLTAAWPIYFLAVVAFLVLRFIRARAHQRDEREELRRHVERKDNE